MPKDSEVFDRRRFLTRLAGAAGALALGGGRLHAHASSRRGDHPVPRPGIDASKVLKADQVPPEVAELYDAVRRIPHVVDGIRCYCGCADVEGFYSLLSCYEQSGMASECEVCQGEGRLVTRMHAEGHTLDEIRAEIDRRFA